MEFGASIFFTDYSISPAELAVAPEEQVLGESVLFGIRGARDGCLYILDA